MLKVFTAHDNRYRVFFFFFFSKFTLFLFLNYVYFQILMYKTYVSTTYSSLSIIRNLGGGDRVESSIYRVFEKLSVNYINNSNYRQLKKCITYICIYY